MASLHIGTITFDWYLSDGRVIRLVEAATDAGYDVDVICLRQPHEKPYEICNGIHVYRMPMSRGQARSLPATLTCWGWFLLLAAVAITKLHIKNRYDVIHVHNMPDFLVFSTLIPKLLGAKIILDVQDVSPELMALKATGRLKWLVTRLATLQEHISTSFADHVVTVGWPFEELLLKRGVPEEKLTTILNSTDPKVFPPSRRNVTRPTVQDSPFTLIYYGTVAERHGMDILIRAVAIACKAVPQLKLNIKGRNEHLEHIPALKMLVAELGIEDRVVFSEACSYWEIVDFIVHGDVGVIPYQCDGFTDLLLPTKAYELAWLHRPIIASDTKAIRSMFRPGSIALCEPTSPESFAEAIIDLYQHPEKRNAMVASAAEDYTPFQWEAMAKRYQLLLASLSNKQENNLDRAIVELEVTPTLDASI